jgi:hypothetical protein
MQGLSRCTHADYFAAIDGSLALPLSFLINRYIFCKVVANSQYHSSTHEMVRRHTQHNPRGMVFGALEAICCSFHHVSFAALLPFLVIMSS